VPLTDSKNLNNCSIVTVLSYARSKIIIPGDNESSSWKALLKRNDLKTAIKDADILLAPHHGRESGWHAELL
jgi:competence protein ComEC